VRLRYDFRCGYCGVSEEDVGGELTVDHFHPAAAGGDDSDENLVYACVRCNQYKGALLPEMTGTAQQPRLLHPLQGDLAIHLQVDERTGCLDGLTEAGRRHIAALRLNRPALQVNRQRRLLLGLLEARLDQALAENGGLKERIARLELYIAYLEERLEARSPPSDPQET